MTATFSRIAVAVALLSALLTAGCSERSVNSDSSGGVTLRLKTSTPVQLQAIARAEATIIPQPLGDHDPVVIELSISDGTVEGSASDIPAGRVLVMIDLWDESGALVWHGETTTTITPIITNDVEVSLGPPPERIDNEIVYLHFDHAHGAIDSLVFKAGAGVDLLDQAMNAETVRYGLGGLARLEDNTRLRGFVNYGDSLVVTYENLAAYGNKTFVLRWSEFIGFEMDMHFYIAESLLVSVGCWWSPGGDNDEFSDADSMAVRTDSSAGEVYRVRYDTSYSSVYEGPALSLAWWDGIADEVFGFRLEQLKFVSCYHGSGALGPVIGLEIGSHTISFAIKEDREAFAIWAIGSYYE